MALAPALAVDLGRDVAPVDGDDLAAASFAARHQATLRCRLTETASANGSRPTWTCSNSRPSISAALRPAVHDRRIVGLRQQHDAPVVAEVGVAQFGMAVEPERPPHQRVEVLGEEVGQVERAGLRLVQRREQLRSGHELVAVVAGQPGGAVTDLVEQPIEVAAGAAVAVAEHQRRSPSSSIASCSRMRRHDPLGTAVVRRRQVADLDRVGQAELAEHRAQIAGERAAGDQERLRHGAFSSGRTAPGGSATRSDRRAFTSSLAVSAATAASRQ